MKKKTNKRVKSMFIIILILVSLFFIGKFAGLYSITVFGGSEHYFGTYGGAGGLGRPRFGMCNLGNGDGWDLPIEKSRVPPDTMSRGDLYHYYPNSYMLSGQELDISRIDIAGFWYDSSNCNGNELFMLQAEIDGEKYCLFERDTFFSDEICNREMSGTYECDGDAIDWKDYSDNPLMISENVGFTIDLVYQRSGITCFEIIPFYNTEETSILVSSGHHFIKGYNNSLDLKINNNLGAYDYVIEVKSDFDTPIGKTSWVEEKEYFLSEGENNVVFPLNNTNAIGEINFEIELLAKRDGWDAVRLWWLDREDERRTKEVLREDAIEYFGADSTGDVDAEFREYYYRKSDRLTYEVAEYYKPVVFDKVADTNFQVLISPLPTYADVGCLNNPDGCPSGYACQIETGLCLLEEAYEQELPCQVINCPTLEYEDGSKVTYECNSNGYCSQTLVAKKGCTVEEAIDPETNETMIVDSCGEGLKCDVNNEVCVNELFFDKFLSCDDANDCVTLCQGQSISCEFGRCVYEGECETIDAPTCVETGCPEGYKCDYDTGNCIKKPFKWWIYAIIIAVIIMISLLLKKKKRRKRR